MQILLPEAYLSFPSLGKPAKNNIQPDQAPRYKCDLIFPAGADLTELMQKIEEVRAEALNTRQPKNPPLKPCSKKIAQDTGLVQPLYDKGEFFISPWSGESNPPALVGPDGKAGYHAANYKGGNLVQAIVNIWGSNHAANPSVGFGLMAVQWRGEGEQVTPTANLNLFTPASTKMDAAALGI